MIVFKYASAFWPRTVDQNSWSSYNVKDCMDKTLHIVDLQNVSSKLETEITPGTIRIPQLERK
jgi:hypothetical protein